MAQREVRGVGRGVARRHIAGSLRLGRVSLLVATVVAGLLVSVAPAHAAWSPASSLAVPGHQIVWSDVAYDGSGRGYIMYSRYVSGFVYEVYVSERPPGSNSWGAWETVPTGTGQVANPVLDVNVHGDVLLAFQRSGQVAAMIRPNGGSWEPMVSYSSPGTSGPNSGFASGLDAAIGDDGTAVMTWSINNSCCGVVSKWRIGAVANIPGSGWEPSAQYWGTSVQDVHSRPAVTVEMDGAAIVAFGARTSSVNLDQLWTAQLDAGAWSAPVLRSSVFNGSNVQVVGDSFGTTAAFGFARGTIMQVILREAGSWSPTFTVSSSNSGGSPTIAVGGGGAVHVGFRNQSGQTGGILASGTAATGFTSQLISATGGVPQAATNAAGDLALVWDEYVPGGRLANVSYRPAGGSFDPSPTQLTSTLSTNDTLSSIAMDEWGHALVEATPIGTGTSFGTSLEVMIEQRDPVEHDEIDLPTISPVSAEVGEQVSCAPAGFAGTLPVRYAYEWLRDGQPIAGADSNAYTVQPDDAGEPIICRVTATNEGGTAVADSDELVVSYTAPANLSLPVVSGVAEVGELVVCGPGTWSGEPAPELAFEWARGGVLVAGETADSYEISIDDAGDTLACIVTATNPGGSDVAASVAVSVAPVEPPVNVTRPTIAGPTRPSIGDTLTCRFGTWTGAPAPGLYPEWLRDGLLIAGSYAETYVVTPADAATVVSCQVTAENVAGSETVASTNWRALDAAPANTALPVVRTAAGSTWAVGQTARCARGSWTNGRSYEYQWFRDGSPIADAATQDYLLSDADAGGLMTCEVTATGRMGTAVAMSAPRLLPGAPIAVTPPTISGTPRPLRTLRCARGTWTDARSFQYSWLVDGIDSSVVGTRYVVQVADIGSEVQCRVVATGSGGSTTAVSAPLLITP